MIPHVMCEKHQISHAIRDECDECIKAEVYEDGKNDARAKIVAWLREQGETEYSDDIADAIERGDPWEEKE